jgi:exodeoxyribonuclease VII small subunit
MEGGQLSLENMIARFEEGQSLIKLCSRKLSEVERKVEILVKKGDALTAEPFDAGGDGDAEEPPPADGETEVEGGSKELF